MKRAIKAGSLLLLLLFIAIQFVPIKRVNPAIISDFDGPRQIKAIFRESCYDCHSNETNWPWYAHLAPVSWLISHDVVEGRQELNFSDWKRYGADAEKRAKIAEEVSEGVMPLGIYVLMHPKAKLTPEEVTAINAWAESSL